MSALAGNKETVGSSSREILSADDIPVEGLVSDHNKKFPRIHSKISVLNDASGNIASAIICRLNGDVSPRLTEIERESNSPPWSERLFANEFQNECALIFGARLEGEIVGFLICHAVVDEAHVVNFAIASNYRKRGIGYALISHVLRDLHLRGVRWVTLEVRKSNQAARALYDELGFAEVGVRAGYYPDNQEDAIVMSLNIRQFIDSFGAEEFPQA